MRKNCPFIIMLISLFVIVCLGGCAKFATSDQKIAAIEDKVSVGMPESKFTETVPNAELINTTEYKSVYAVRVSPPCFICGSRDGFVNSYESYATLFIFENGKLSSFNRFLNGE